MKCVDFRKSCRFGQKCADWDKNLQILTIRTDFGKSCGFFKNLSEVKNSSYFCHMDLDNFCRICRFFKKPVDYDNLCGFLQIMQILTKCVDFDNLRILKICASFGKSCRFGQNVRILTIWADFGKLYGLWKNPVDFDNSCILQIMRILIEHTEFDNLCRFWQIMQIFQKPCRFWKIVQFLTKHADFDNLCRFGQIVWILEKPCGF